MNSNLKRAIQEQLIGDYEIESADDAFDLYMGLKSLYGTLTVKLNPLDEEETKVYFSDLESFCYEVSEEKTA